MREKIPEIFGKRRFSRFMSFQHSYFSTSPPNQQQAQFRVSPALGLKGRPVTSLEEVKAAAVDFDGSISFFPDLANGKIYTKQCNIDGTASLNMYEIKEIPVAPNNNDFVTREEFNSALLSLKQALSQTNLVEQKQPEQTSNLEFKF